MEFRACAISTFGAFSAEAAGILKWITDRLLSRFSVRDGMILARQVKERVSVAVMKGVGRQLAKAAACSGEPFHAPPVLEWRQNEDAALSTATDEAVSAVLDQTENGSLDPERHAAGDAMAVDPVVASPRSGGPGV